MSPVISARGLRKEFGAFVAVDGIDFDVAPGESFGFLGPNGAGKTSTMRMIGCVSPITSGTMQIFGLDPARDGPAIRARMGVVPQADQMSVKDIARLTRDLAEKARTGALTPDEVTGGTFTVTTLGMYDVQAFTPIVNPPEVAILGVGAIVEKPAVFEGTIVKRSLMYLSLSFDHRLVDGAPAAESLRRIKYYLERPYLLLT